MGLNLPYRGFGTKSSHRELLVGGMCSVISMSSLCTARLFSFITLLQCTETAKGNKATISVPSGLVMSFQFNFSSLPSSSIFWLLANG